MSITRDPRPDSGWYALNRRIAEDARLSWAARGLLIFLLVKPDHWRISVEHLRKQTEDARIPTGRDGIYALLTELQRAGYVSCSQARTPDGRLAEREYRVSESPKGAKSPLPAEPYAAGPYPAEPTLDKTKRAGKTDIQKRALVHPADARQLALIESRFEEFWRRYPVKKGRKMAESRWKARGLGAIADTILAHVDRMMAEDGDWKAGFIPHGSTYVNGARWEDEPAPERGRQESGMMAALREAGVGQ